MTDPEALKGVLEELKWRAGSHTTEYDLACKGLAALERLLLSNPIGGEGLDLFRPVQDRDRYHPLAVVVREAHDDFLRGAASISDDMAVFVTRRVLDALSISIIGNSILATDPNPPAEVQSGGGGDPVGCAEREVGRYVYNIISARMSAKPGTPEIAELAYLARIVSDVEEYGADTLSEWDIAMGCDFPSPTPTPESPWRAIDDEARKGQEILIRRTDTAFPEDEYHVVAWDDGRWQVHDGKSDHPLRGPEPTLWMSLSELALPPAPDAGEKA